MIQLTTSMRKYIESICTGELVLPEEEMNSAVSCRNCKSELTLKSQDLLEKTRRQPKPEAEEVKLLYCAKCKETFSISEQLDQAMEDGFNRFGVETPSRDEVIDLKWVGLPKPPNGNTANPQFQKWLLLISAIQVDVQMHDWRHRRSCFKKKGDPCRYKLPREPTKETMVKPIYSSSGGKYIIVQKQIKLIINSFFFRFLDQS